MDPSEIVDGLLKDAAPPPTASQRFAQRNPELLAALVHFLDLKAANDPRVSHLSTTWFYEQKLRPKFAGSGRTHARTYVRDVLRRDWATGLAL